MSGTVNFNNKTVSDENLKTILQRVADLYGKEVKVTSGDRGTALSFGGGTGSLHLQHRAVDFHVLDELDANVYARLKTDYKTIFDIDQRYEVIHHGPHTDTSGQHVHIGRYASGTPAVIFKVEGLTEESAGTYTVQQTLIVPKQDWQDAGAGRK